LTQFSWRSR